MAQSHGVFLPKGSSIYYCTVQVQGEKKRASTGCRAKKDAIAFARRWKAALIEEAKAVQATGPQMTMLQGVTRYMEESGDHLVARGQYEVFFDWLLDHIGEDTPLSSIDNSTLARLMMERGCEYRFGCEAYGLVAKSYVERSVLIPLRTLLKRASELWGVSLPNEPTWGRHKVKGRFRTRVMSYDEEAAIRAVVSDDLWALIEFVLLSGLRREDALIEWSQVDRTARVIRCVIKGNRPHEVRITPGIRDLLDGAAQAGGQCENVWTWVPRAGANAGRRQPMSYSMFQKLWEAARKRAGVKGLNIHDLRRTAGERLYRATGDIYAVSRFLGHTSVERTQAYYVHIQPDDVEERQLAMEWVRSKSLEEHSRLPPQLH